MKPIDELIYEHNTIKVMLSIMSEISKNIKDKKVFYTNDVEKIVGFLFIYVDKYHRIKEEKVFYPALLSSKIQIENDKINEMINEHTIGKGYLNEIICCVENCKIGSTFSCGRIADCLENYVNLIQNHIQKEEETYFQLANQTFSQETQSEISNSFLKIDTDFRVSGLFEKQKELFGLMKAKYLN